MGRPGGGETRWWRDPVTERPGDGGPSDEGQVVGVSHPDVSDLGRGPASGMRNHPTTTPFRGVSHPTYAYHYCSYHSWVAGITVETITRVYGYQ
jgi:hypothetical protein